MQKARKRNILGILIDEVDYDGAVRAILKAAQERRPFSVSALAVHGVMTGVLNSEHRYRLNHLDLLAPDGQPVRWAMRFLYGIRLEDRVYGPRLTLEVCDVAAREGLPIYFYGSSREILDGLCRKLRQRFPKLIIAGTEPSKFRRISPSEKEDVVQRIHASGAAIVFVGLGCPRQEVWAYEFAPLVSCPVLAVGAAFAFHAGEVPQAPVWMQNAGLEWLFRLAAEPRRLWKRYLFLNPAYLALLLLQATKVGRFSDEGQRPKTELLFG
ncbi:MAG TPA: WecB/TagA/CpsF family glycosyltransferase [Candidatus Dormibacteraeota bacterium]|nr:WecB/TagA/CpsF family glycosyltransferase [Candidatus Dormibacteraeota bacterium]